jgi:hypothetical protein
MTVITVCIIILTSLLYILRYFSSSSEVSIYSQNCITFIPLPIITFDKLVMSRGNSKIFTYAFRKSGALHYLVPLFIFFPVRSRQNLPFIQKKFSPACIARMQAAVSREEIRKTIFSMNKNKALGPDRFSVRFFHKAWSVIEDGDVKAVMVFFESGNLLKEVNAMIITLVPKKKNPTSMSEYMPISCCNLISKSIIKILANRLLPGLDEVISLNQGAFIPKRSIVENILFAQEMVCDYHKEKGNPRCTLKVDLMKAYDSVSWDFILHCLICFGAPSKFVGWIKECISSPSYSSALNGTLVGFFSKKERVTTRGPYLSLLICSSHGSALSITS